MANCKTCGENSVIEDYENGRTVLVCTECGSLENDSQEFETKNYLEGTSLSDGQARGPNGLKAGSQCGPKKKQGIVFGKKHIERIGKLLHLSESIISGGTSMYNRVHETLLRYCASDTKMAMCGACLYCVARQQGHGINIKDVGRFLDVEHAGKKLTVALKMLQKKCDIYPPAVTITRETEHFVLQNDFSPDVRKLTHDIVSLCERYWISQGRITNITIKVAAYFAWRASEVSNYNKDLTIFCKKFGLEQQRACSQRKVELEKLLRTSVQEIPWLKGQKIACIDPYIKDVVKYQASLMQPTMQNGADRITENINSNEQSEEKVWLEKAKELGTVFRDSEKRKHKLNTEVSSGDGVCKKKRFRKETENESDLDLGSDDDTDQYIRTAREVENIKSIRDKFSEVQEG